MAISKVLIASIIVSLLVLHLVEADELTVRTRGLILLLLLLPPYENFYN